jgi:hypothetical protein
VKTEWRTSIGAAIVLAVILIIYVFWAPGIESASGATMLLFSLAAYGMLGCYLILQWLRRHRIPRPEDDFEAEISDSEGAIDFFPSASIWPAGIGLGVIITSLTFIFGNWYWLIGLPLIFGGVIGFVVEADHSENVLLDVPEDLRQHYRHAEDAPTPTE